MAPQQGHGSPVCHFRKECSGFALQVYTPLNKRGYLPLTTHTDIGQAVAVLAVDRGKIGPPSAIITARDHCLQPVLPICCPMPYSSTHGLVPQILSAQSVKLLTADRQQIKIRLSDIDTPERKQLSLLIIRSCRFSGHSLLSPSGCHSAVAMVQATDMGKRNNVTHLRRFNKSCFRRILIQR